MKESEKIAREEVERGGQYFVVSTVSLPINHGNAEQPLWFETMVFEADSRGSITDYCDLKCNRYETIEEAIEGHKETVIMVEDGEIG